ncbi:hypothetical protein FRC06_008208, partial [Ceratobasidium sp. 370]
NRKPKASENQGTDTNPQLEDAEVQSSSKAKSGRGAQKSKRKGKQKELANDGGAIAQAGTSAGSNTQDKDELPIGWLPCWSVEHNTYFFYNTTTGNRTWDDPRLQ